MSRLHSAAERNGTIVGEFDLIKRHLAVPSSSLQRRRDGYAFCDDVATGVVLGPGDDATLLSVTPNHQLVISVDTSIVDVHFPNDAPARAVGHRALAVSLSDLAAMGARARWYLLALSLPDDNEPWVAEMAEGMHTLAARCGVTLVGGDTTRGQLSLSMTVHGEVLPGQAIRRDGAQSGDLIGVVGSLGAAAGGLALWQAGERASSFLLDAYLYPTPLLAVGEALAGHVSAGIDVSDGLLADLSHLCRASGVGAELYVEALPLCRELKKRFGTAHAVSMALHGGDDYALLLTLAPKNEDEIRARLEAVGQSLYVIGRTTQESGIFDAYGQPLAVNGWQHF